MIVIVLTGESSFLPHPPTPSPYGEGAVRQNRAKLLVLPHQQNNKASQRKRNNS